MYNLMLGEKYYKYDENNNINVVRICRIYNEREVQLYNENDKSNKFKMNTEDLIKNYIKLNPHAVINFCIVKIGNNLDDVIVTMHKWSDLISNEPTPYCVCRQNITDVFANQLKISDKLYVGCSMSLNTCPPDIDYRIMIACNGITKCVNICAYMDDTLDDIISLIQTKDYDNALNALFMDHASYEKEHNNIVDSIYNILIKMNSYDGYCKTLKLLLEQNNFMYDFYQAFNIIPINEKVIYDKDTGALDDNITNVISELHEVNIVSTLCMKYWYDIDLSSIDNEYVLLLDNNNDLFVVAYVSNGPKHINIENVESEENIERLANSTIGNNKSIREAADHIRLNKSKYI